MVATEEEVAAMDAGEAVADTEEEEMEVCENFSQAVQLRSLN